MIGYLTGTILRQHANQIVVMTTGGVGYVVHLPTAKPLNNVTVEPISLYIYTHVREDQLTLYGFNDYETQEFFEMLLDVSGIGPKSALTIVGYAPIDKLEAAIRSNDDTFFKHITGIGSKTAQRIVIECAPKLKSHASLAAMHSNEGDTLVAALAQLGFSQQEIRDAIQKGKPSGSLEEQITICLQFLTRHE